jgi:glutamate carboxypeptidase
VILDERLPRARARTGEMVALLRALVEIESPSTDAAGVHAMGVRVGEVLSTLGLAVELLPMPAAGPVLRASWPGERPLMLLGHLDTVWPLGTLATRPVRIEGDVFHGPGSYDMKAGIVVIVEALRLLAESGRRPAVTVLLTPLEETRPDPYRARMEAEMKTCAAVLGFEPAWPGGAVKTERKGAGTFRLRARGRAAHAGADFTKGASAILEIARKTLEVSALTDADRGITVNVGVIRGGIRPNVVADSAEAELDVRVKTLDDARRVEAALRALPPSTPGVTLEVSGSFSAPPLERNAGVLALYEEARSAAAQMGIVLDHVSTGGASEASFAAALGVPTLDGLGADGDGAHAEHEHVKIASLPERAALCAALIERLSSRGPSDSVPA